VGPVWGDQFLRTPEGRDLENISQSLVRVHTLAKLRREGELVGPSGAICIRFCIYIASITALVVTHQLNTKISSCGPQKDGIWKMSQSRERHFRHYALKHFYITGICLEILT